MSATTILTLMAVQQAAADENVLQRLREAGAVSPSSAVAVEPRDEMIEAALERLRKRSVVREAEPGRFYVDEALIAAQRGAQNRQVAQIGIALAVLLAIALGAVLLVR